MTSAPSWFARAVSSEPSSASIEIDARRVHYLTWGDASGDPVMLVHGNGAHARWWTFIAPFLAASGRYVAAIDLGGMGDSEAPADLGLEPLARQLHGVVARIGGTRPVRLVGHSFGGLVSAAMATASPELIAQLVIVDSPFHIDARSPARKRRQMNTVYPDRAAVLKRFRLLPPQPMEHSAVFDFIAETSIEATPEGWTWKFRSDPWESGSLAPDAWAAIGARLGDFPRPTAFLRGEHSALCQRESEIAWRRFAGERTQIVVIPQAHHHVILDQPLAVVAALETLFTAKQNS